MRVIIQKVDLDTCLTGLILGVGAASEVVVRPAGATAAELNDTNVLCIEAGGSGDIASNNFDHHGPGAPHEAACVQVAGASGVTEPQWLRLVEYVSAVDTGLPLPQPNAAFPTLSNVFSGMLLVEPDDARRFQSGITLLSDVLRLGVDPFGTMPAREEWRGFVDAKRAAQASLREDVKEARFFLTRRGARAGFVATAHPGALGALYGVGCDYAIAFSTAHNDADASGARKVTLGTRRGGRVDSLLPLLNWMEDGWGGPSHGSIIGSPRTGTALPIDLLCALVRAQL